MNDSQLDRLVDGELKPDEYRQLLAELNADPDGWRRCALAFLEAQALSGHLSALRRNLEPLRPASGSSARDVLAADGTDAARCGTRWAWRSGWALAASIAVVFLLGVGAGWNGRWMFDEPAAQHATERATPQSSRVSIADATKQPVPQVVAMPKQLSPPQPIAKVRVLVGPNDEESQRLELPVFEPQQLNSSALSRDRSQWANSVIDFLERSGHRIRHRQQLLPLVLEDGREAVVPVDGFEISPIRNVAY